ncbi:MAG TPA: adenosylcobinamide-GDP ribazoletransferase [Lachnospiraceae bacterium]|nr:adenosylcobinamide-GDP ribazoletransferase [Lachnospiraceae bacterium]
MIQSLMIAFSMYSKIPMPRVEWNEKNMKYSMCFFPLVGLVLGAICYAVATLLYRGELTSLSIASIMTVLPIAVTGGIHVDGLLDTIDALHSYGDREKKLAILKDPHTGAFAIIGACCYFILNLGVWSEMPKEALPVIAISYVLTRALSGFSIVTFPLAKSSGLAATFQDMSQKMKVRITMLIYIFLCFGAMLLIDVSLGLTTFVIAAGVFLYYYGICRKHFGGITGDLAGYFLQVCELAILIGVAIVSRIA